MCPKAPRRSLRIIVFSGRCPVRIEIICHVVRSRSDFSHYKYWTSLPPVLFYNF